jgi:hypothetical protein
MKRLRSHTPAPRALLSGLPLLVLAASCTSQPVILPSRDFDRPTDVAFVCMGTFGASAAPVDDAGADGGDVVEAGAPVGATIVSGRPMRECHPRGTDDVLTVAAGGTDATHHTFAFLPNSSSGELSVIDADKWSLVNLDPANAGFNRLPLGVLPSQIAASDDGCRLVTANHGSCDLSFVDPAALLTPTIARETGMSVAATGSPPVNNVVPRTKSGRELRVLAGEVSFLPMGTAAMTAGEALCSVDPSHQWQALATFPSCDLVALIDLPSGIIQKAAYATKAADGTVGLRALGDDEEPSCRADCTFPAVPDASPEAATGATDAGVEAPGAGDGGLDAGASQADADAGAPDAEAEAGAPEAGAPEAGADATAAAPPPVDPGDVPYVGPGALRPGPIAIEPESGRAFVGLGNAAFVLGFNVGPNQLDTSLAAAIPLHEGALGVDRLRLSIDPYKDKTSDKQAPPGSFVGDDPGNDASRQFVLDRQYLYAVARDGSLRVVQVAHLPETECETNLDLTLISGEPAHTDAMNAACPPVTGPSARRPSAVGPGIRLPAPAVDIAVVDVRPDPPDKSETSVSGAHAYVLTASGAVYLVNIDPVTRAIFFVEDSGHVQMCETPAGDCHPEPDPAPNTLRNRGFVGYSLSLDTSIGPARLDVPPAQPSIGPRIEPIWTRGSSANATALTGDFIRTHVVFPDPSTVSPQSWSVAWEGNLLANPRLTGQFVPDPGGATVSLVDLGMDFCRIGVQGRDIVTLEGCTNTNQCGIGKECAFGSNGAEGEGGFPITGLCLTPTVPHDHCDDLLSTIKRYEITSAHQNQLGLIPHKDELVRPTNKPCTITSGPGAAADGGTTDAGAPDAREAGASDASTRDAGDGGTSDAREPQMSDCVDPQDPSTSKFECVPNPDPGPEARRCLIPCTVPNDTAGCRTGRICISFGASTGSCADGKCFCADAPSLVGDRAANVVECLGELFPYQVGVGRGFAISGSQAGIPATGIADATGACMTMPNLDPRVRTRIPMDAPACGAAVPDNTLDSRCNPNLSDPGCPMVDMTTAPSDVAQRQNLAATSANRLLQILQTKNDPNPCLFMGGPNETDAPNSVATHPHALFRNREVQFMLTNLDRPPSGVFQVRFDVHGGFTAQTVAIPPATVEVTMPSRIVLGPFDANNPAKPVAGHLNPEVPYLFVVDQRRLGRTQGGGPTRGQLLRINPRGQAITSPAVGNQPWFEDLAHSANQFPIQ